MTHSSRAAGFLIVLVFTTLSSIPLIAQTASSQETDANAAYQSHDWPKAEGLYTTLVKDKPENARFWYRLGVCERANRHFQPALEAFTKAKQFGAGTGLPPFIADYELASTYAAMGDQAHALAALKQSADGGYSQTDRIDSDAEWNAMRTDSQFLSLAKQVKHNAAPCEDPEFRQFDFWLGDWDVTSTGLGVAQGTSHISSEMGGCVVWENWTSAGNTGYFGKSYNTYNVNLQRWEQYWVDNAAGTMFFHGTLKDGVMDYWTGEIPQPNGDKLLRHLQFFNLSKDQVRQFSQRSIDGGKTWSVEYDFTYTRHVGKA